MKAQNNHINYIEFKAKYLKQTEVFYQNVFGWQFTSYGPNYVAFAASGVEGGFEKTDEPIVNGALVVLYHSNLEEVLEKVTAAGGTISKEIFSFPGGKRFQFLDPSGNELAVWLEI